MQLQAENSSTVQYLYIVRKTFSILYHTPYQPVIRENLRAYQQNSTLIRYANYNTPTGIFPFKQDHLNLSANHRSRKTTKQNKKSMSKW